MSRRTKLAGFLLLICVTATVGFIKADDEPVYKIISRLNEWTANDPIEKVYLQLDKPYYSAGDDIWFKAYVIVGPQHKLSGLSGVLNVELIDELDSVKQHIKLPVKNGLARGAFTLPDTLPEGNYRIRAYTNYMRNAGSDYFFDQRINIINVVNSKVFTNATYSFATENGQQKVNAVINYTNVDGVAYINKAVRYTVDLNSAKPIQGKGITDDKGNIAINFLNASPAPVNTGIITTVITMAKDNEVTRVIPIKATSANVDVQFFPEGGSLVNGVNSKIAFKAVSADGLGAAIRGEVIDNKNNVVASFTSQHLGMGVFDLTPDAGISYKAHIIYADGSTGSFDMPKAIDKGDVLSIDNSDPDSVRVNIITSRKLLTGPDDSLILMAQSGGQVYYAGKSKPGVTKFTASVAKSRFPSGIVQFTLFSSTNEPLNERLVFIQNPDQLKLNISTDKANPAPQQKVKLNLNAINSEGKPATGSFSVAVVDETRVPVIEEDEGSIMSNLLLTSELRGYIEKPNYYFTNISEKTRADLDVLMLTQGYHRFEWKKVLNGDFPPVPFAPEKTLEVTGHITTNSGKPIAHGKVSLISTKGGFFVIDTVTDEQGKFVFENLEFMDSIRFALQARTAKDGKNVQIYIDNVSTEKAAGSKNRSDIKINVSDGLSAYLQNSKALYMQELKYGLANRTIVLKEVEIKSSRPVVKYSDNLNGPGNADQVLTGGNLGSGCPTFADCMQGKLVGVQFINNRPYSLRGSPPAPMNVEVDGFIFKDADEYSYLNMNDVASIEVLRSGFYLGVYGAQAGPGGLIVVTTKRGKDRDNEFVNRPAPGIVTFSPIGYYKAREFYSPQYDDPKTNIAVADLRSTIYWNPDVVTDKDGNASMEFFNAGSKGTYRVTVEGIDIDGKLGRQVYRYKVE